MYQTEIKQVHLNEDLIIQTYYIDLYSFIKILIWTKLIFLKIYTHLVYLQTGKI